MMVNPRLALMDCDRIWRIPVLVLIASILAGPPAQAQEADEDTAAPKYPRINRAVGYMVDPHWPARPSSGQWGAMPGVTIDSEGNIWTFNRGDAPVQVFRPDGTLIRSWGEGQFDLPHQIKIDTQGHVWLADAGLHVVRKYSPEGEILMTLGTPGEKGEDESHFFMPTDMAITPDGEVFVADGYGNARIVHFDAEGRFVKAWGRLGAKPGEFSIPHAIALDSRGHLYVADRNNVRVQVFDQSGRFLASWDNLIVPWDIWVTPEDEVYVCGSSPMRWPKLPLPGLSVGIPPKDQILIRFDTDGRALQLWTFPKGEDGREKPGELNWVHGIAVDSCGHLYLGDIMGRRVQKFLREEPDSIEDEPGDE